MVQTQDDDTHWLIHHRCNVNMGVARGQSSAARRLQVNSTGLLGRERLRETDPSRSPPSRSHAHGQRPDLAKPERKYAREPPIRVQTASASSSVPSVCSGWPQKPTSLRDIGRGGSSWPPTSFEAPHSLSAGPSHLPSRPWSSSGPASATVRQTAP